MYKVRFHLGQGENFRKWQIKNTATGAVDYVNPETCTLVMVGCKLRVQPAAARKINRRETSKTVCAWIDAEQVRAQYNGVMPKPKGPVVRFNPHVSEHWQGEQGETLDNAEIPAMVTSGRAIFQN